MKTTMSFISIVIISIMLTSHTIPVTVTGTVTDAAGNPLPGVLVKAKPGSATAYTGNNGFYRITPEDKSLTLVFSLQGYTTVTEKIAARNLINIVMNPSPVPEKDVIKHKLEEQSRM